MTISLKTNNSNSNSLFSKERNMVIYRLTNITNGKVYIGQTSSTLKDRIEQHKNNPNNPNSYSYNTSLSCAIREYGWENFELYILDKFLQNQEQTQKQLDECERLWIAFYNSTNRENGYNIDHGGNGKGKMSDEIKLKLSLAKAKARYNEVRLELSEAKKKISESHTGKHTGEKSPMFGRTGEKHPMFGNTSVDKETVELIRKDHNDGMKGKDLAIKYKTSPNIISHIINHKRAYKK